MLDTQELLNRRGQTLMDRDGNKVGQIKEIYIDDATGKPDWALVHTGLFGMRSNFAPVAEATPASDGGLQVPYAKDQVKNAPKVEPDQHLSQEEEAELFRHYGIEYGQQSRTGLPEGQQAPERPPTAVGHDTRGPETDDAMTRSEEEIQVGKQQRETGRARLRKYVTTEQVQQTVPVQREEARVEREPITDQNVEQATRGPAWSEEEHEVVLHEEEPTVEKREVPKERVRLDKEQVTEEQQVSEERRKEQIEVEEPGDKSG
jgi:uncharacterized protein (TIGR02271 family)